MEQISKNYEAVMGPPDAGRRDLEHADAVITKFQAKLDKQEAEEHQHQGTEPPSFPWPPWKAWEGAPLTINGEIVGRLTKIEIGPIEPDEAIEEIQAELPNGSLELIGLDLPHGAGEDLREWFRRIYTPIPNADPSKVGIVPIPNADPSKMKIVPLNKEDDDAVRP